MGKAAEPNLVVRDMRPGEEAFVVDLTLSIWDKVSVAKDITDRFGSLNGHPWTDHKADQILAEVNKADAVLIGDLVGSPVAFATLLYDRKYATGAVGHLGVARGIQDKGLGRAMLRECVARMKRDGMKYARIDTLVRNERGAHLYQSEGFEEIARTMHMFRVL
jgi:ribosomal protein S18 acetylase RimI-like enzyme